MGRAKNQATRGGARRNTRLPLGTIWDKSSKVDEYDGRANTQAGTAGAEPGGRFSTAYYDGPSAIISRNNLRNPGAKD